MQLSVKEAAALLNVDATAIHKWIKQAEIPYHQVNESIRFNRAELLEWATARNVCLSPHLFASNPKSGSTPAVTLAGALAEGGVAYRVGGTDQGSVLRAIVSAMSLPDAVDRDFLYDVLMAREELGSTGVGDGIAIPHVRNPVVLQVQRPIVTLSFLELAIDFRAMDGKPVHTLFTLVSPTIQSHLNLLSRIGFVLRDREVKEALLRQAPPEEILKAVAGAEAAVQQGPGASAPR